ncbi:MULTISPECIES: ATP-binding protein [Streptomyces]|uniref:ATP-binding protein n=2 Tax=Streptomyces TaxID=1883 RepID=A0ABV9IIV3_9ACTN
MTRTPIDALAIAGDLTKPSDGEAPRCFQTADALRADLASIPPTRRRLRAFLCRSGLGEIADMAALLSTELLANAVTHGCSEFPPKTEVTMTATYDGQRLRLAVHDPSDSQPCLRAASEDQEHGRGLMLVASLADRWGVTAKAKGTGKSVWLELECSSSQSEEGL